MLDRFSALLEARQPNRGHFRSYHIEAGTDLLGDWLVVITFGRIGSPGHSLCYAFNSEDEAKTLVRQTLRRRETARKRIGTEYRLTELRDPEAWCPSPFRFKE